MECVVSVPQSLKEPSHRPEDPEAHRRGTDSHTVMRREPPSPRFGEGGRPPDHNGAKHIALEALLNCNFFASKIL